MQNLKFAFRQLLKDPSFTAVAVLTLALGIGANTAMFSVVNAVLLRPLPFSASERLELISSTGDFGEAMAGGDFRAIRDQATAFSHITAYATGNMNLSGAGQPERISTAQVTASFEATLGTHPLLGRTFSSSEDQPASGQVVLLSHKLWREHFGADQSVVGRSVNLDAKSYSVIGVMPQGFEFPESSQAWTPLGLGASELNDYDNYHLRIVAPLAPGASIGMAQHQLAGISARSVPLYPAFRKDWKLRAVPLHEYLVGGSRDLLWILSASVGLVLFIACANVANLLLARATGRQREMALRLALGAGRGRLVRQLLVESVILALLGGAGGALLAACSMGLVNNWLPADIPRLEPIHLDLSVLCFTATISLLAGVAFGLAPVVQASGDRLGETLKQGTRMASEGRSTRRLRAALVVSEMAVAVILLVGAGLLLKSFLLLQQAPLGFRPEHTLTARLDLPPAKYSSPERLFAFQNQLLDQIHARPGVVAAGVSSALPLAPGNLGYLVAIDGRTPTEFKPGVEFPGAAFRSVSAEYFRTLGIPLLAGRWFTSQDTASSSRVAVVNDAMARKMWPNESPLGHRIKPLANQSDWYEIVGVVGGVRHATLDKAPDPEMFVPFSQTPDTRMYLAVRTASEPKEMALWLRNALASLDPDQPLYSVRTMEERVNEAVAQPKFRTVLLGTFGAVALGLALIGTYGVIAYSVAQRTQEIGTRMALGAQTSHVQGLVLRQGLILALLGLGIGLAGALAATRVLKGMLYATAPTDPWAFASVSLLLIATALLASYLPARRASRVDPMVALRYE